jgi:S-DNA-T family DNA segregation ATPase FtsK/SpoIIIE
VVILLLILSSIIITKTPPNRACSAAVQLYAWLFGAEPQDDEQRQAAKDAKATKTKQVELDGIDDDADEGDPNALQWWRRNTSKREKTPTFGGAVVEDPMANLSAVARRQWTACAVRSTTALGHRRRAPPVPDS